MTGRDNLDGHNAGRALIRTLTAITVAILALCSGALSYHALHELAVEQGQTGNLTYLWPIAIDGLLIVGAFTSLLDELDRQSNLLPWAIVIGGTVFSIVAQASMVDRSTVVAKLVAGSPPAALAIAWWLLMRMIRRHLSPVQVRSTTVRRSGNRERTSAPVGRAFTGGETVSIGRVTGRRNGSGDGSRIPPIGVSGVPENGDGTGPENGHTSRGEGPLNRTWPASAERGMTGHGDRSTEAERTRELARQAMAADQHAGRKTTGASLGEALGVSDGHGRRLLRELKSETDPDDGRPQLEAVNA
jgi:Protein of unknown function (DUF2637)